MRVGVFGGSFNPAHEGHRHVAETARKALDLHKVIWLVSPQNPLKDETPAPLAKRLAGVRRVAGPGAIVTAFEGDLRSAFTVDTLSFLRRRHPGVRLFFLMGSDNLRGLPRWRKWRRIPQLAEVAVVSRPGSTVRGRLAQGGRFLQHSGRARFLEGPLHPQSSTALRSRAKG